MKLTKDKESGHIYARLKTGNTAKPYLRMTLGTKSAAEARQKAKDANLEKIEAALQAGSLSTEAIARLSVGRKVTTQQAGERWLAAAENRGESPATTAKNASVLQQWYAFDPAVAKLPPMALNEDHIAPFVNRTTEVSARTRERQLSVLRTFCRYCADLGLAKGNAANRVKVNLRGLTHQQREPKEIKPFTAAEVKRIVSEAEGFWRWATGIGYATGLRLGDVCQLEHACLSQPGHIVVWTEKRDRRVCLPVNEKLTPGLAGVLAEVPPTDSRFLFPDAAAQYDDIASGRPKFSMQFKRLVESLGIEGKSFHSLRHAAISRWQKDGFSLDECKTYAGHSNSKTTKGYIHG